MRTKFDPQAHVSLLIPGTHSRRGFDLELSGQVVHVPQKLFEFLLELVTSLYKSPGAPYLYLNDCMTVAGDPELFKKYVERLRKCLGSAELVITHRKSYSLALALSAVEIHPAVFVLPPAVLCGEILKSLRAAVERHGAGHDPALATPVRANRPGATAAVEGLDGNRFATRR